MTGNDIRLPAPFGPVRSARRARARLSPVTPVTAPASGSWSAVRGRVEVDNNRLTGATVFGITARGARARQSTGSATSSQVPGSAPSTPGPSPATPAPDPAPTPRGWAHHAHVTFLTYLEFHPLAALWLGIARPGAARRRLVAAGAAARASVPGQHPLARATPGRGGIEPGRGRGPAGGPGRRPAGTPSAAVSPGQDPPRRLAFAAAMASGRSDHRPARAGSGPRRSRGRSRCGAVQPELTRPQPVVAPSDAGLTRPSGSSTRPPEPTRPQRVVPRPPERTRPRVGRSVAARAARAQPAARRPGSRLPGRSRWSARSRRHPATPARGHPATAEVTRPPGGTGAACHPVVGRPDYDDNELARPGGPGGPDGSAQTRPAPKAAD